MRAAGRVPITDDIVAKITQFEKKSLKDQKVLYKKMLGEVETHLKKYGQTAGRSNGETLRMERELWHMKRILRERKQTFGPLGELME